MKVDVSVYSWNDVDRKVKEMVEAGEAPDIAQIGAYADYAAKGDLYRPTTCSPSATQADFVAQLADAGEVRRTQYGMPFAASTRAALLQQEALHRGRPHRARPPGRAGRRRRGCSRRTA